MTGMAGADAAIDSTHGSIKYGLIRVLLFNRELRIADHYLRPLSEPYINI